jgi:hypothetical protein
MLDFLVRELKRKEFYLLWACLTTVTVMFGWRGNLRNTMFWRVNNR